MSFNRRCAMPYLMTVFLLIAILAAFGLAGGVGVQAAPYILFGLYLILLVTALFVGIRHRA